MRARSLTTFMLGCALCTTAIRLIPDAYAETTTEPEAKGALQMSTATKALEITVPLKDGKFSVGDIAVQVQSDNAISINRDSILTTLARVMRLEALDAVRKQLVSRNYVDVDELRKAGLGITYIPSELELRLDLKVEQRPRGEISGSRERVDASAETLAKPSAVSAYVNFRGGIDYYADARNDTSHMSLPPVTLEGAARIFGIVLEGEAHVSGDGTLKRGGFRTVFDMPDEALRFTTGDLVPGSVGLQGMPAVIGMSVEKSFHKLQPNKNTRPTGRRSFRIERTSEVLVMVNGLEVRRLHLGPGEYDLDSLPLTHGSNDIQISIKNDLGETQTLNFNILFSHELLAVGMSEWAIAAGLQARPGITSIEYNSDEPVIMASYRRGIQESLTAEGSVLTGAKAGIGRVGALAQTSAGLFLVSAGASLDAEIGAGWQASLDFQTAPKALGEGRSFGITAEAASRQYKPYLESQGVNDTFVRIGAAYSETLWDEVVASTSVHYNVGRDQQVDAFGGGVSLGKALDKDLSVSVSANYESARAAINTNPTGFSILGRVTWRAGDSANVGLTYDATTHVTTGTVSDQHASGASKWGVNLEVAHDPNADGRHSPDNTVSGAVSYIDDRAEVNAYRGVRVGGLGTQRFSETNTITVGTALAYGDGLFGMSRPIHGAFAVIDGHPTLVDKDIRVAPSENGYRATADWLGAAVISDISPYSPSRIPYDVPDAAPGYDLGSGAFEMMAPYKAGYSLIVGSGITVTVGGILRDAKGAPLPLLAGFIHPRGSNEKKIEIFTNGAGRFLAAGLTPGDWEIDMADTPSTHYTLSTGQGKDGVVEIGELQPN